MTADPNGLGAVFDAHTDAKFETRDLEATMATMAETPHVTHVPTMTGGFGRDAVRRFYVAGSSATGPRIRWSSRSRARSARPKWSTR